MTACKVGMCKHTKYQSINQWIKLQKNIIDSKEGTLFLWLFLTKMISLVILNELKYSIFL